MVNRYFIGLITAAVGIIILLAKIGFFSVVAHLFWPIVVLAPGLLLHLLFFRRLSPAGLLIPGGMLITYALLFFFCNLFGWHLMSYLWPVFLVGAAVGLYEYHIFERGNPRGPLIAAVVLAVISAVLIGFALLFTSGVYFIAILLIGIGAIMIVRRPKSW